MTCSFLETFGTTRNHRGCIPGAPAGVTAPHQATSSTSWIGASHLKVRLVRPAVPGPVRVERNRLDEAGKGRIELDGGNRTSWQPHLPSVRRTECSVFGLRDLERIATDFP